MSTSPRKKLPLANVAKLLVETRRRCCLCYFLNDDQSVKRVQIAHIDGKRNNDDESNLVPLCLDHHDEYDSITSQSKGISKEELTIYKAKLIAEYARQETMPATKHATLEVRFMPDMSTNLFYAYGMLFSAISHLIFKLDPISINFGSNWDEYDPEAHDIVGRLQSNPDCKSTQIICYEVFCKWFDRSLAGKPEDYVEMGRLIDQEWNRFRERNIVYSGEDDAGS